jgi:hypothetical protein
VLNNLDCGRVLVQCQAMLNAYYYLLTWTAEEY